MKTFVYIQFATGQSRHTVAVTLGRRMDGESRVAPVRIMDTTEHYILFAYSWNLVAESQSTLTQFDLENGICS